LTYPPRINSEKVLDAACVHDHGAGDDGDAPAALLHFLHHRGDSRDASLDAALGGDIVAHEREAESVALTELRRHRIPSWPHTIESPPRHRAACGRPAGRYR
jgi:hypothetical protein